MLKDELSPPDGRAAECFMCGRPCSEPLYFGIAEQTAPQLPAHAECLRPRLATNIGISVVTVEYHKRIADLSDIARSVVAHLDA